MGRSGRCYFADRKLIPRIKEVGKSLFAGHGFGHPLVLPGCVRGLDFMNLLQYIEENNGVWLEADEVTTALQAEYR